MNSKCRTNSLMFVFHLLTDAVKVAASHNSNAAVLDALVEEIEETENQFTISVYTTLRD